MTKTDLNTHPADLFPALSTYRNLTSTDAALRTALANVDNRLLYAWIGPTPLLDCTWCTPSVPKSYLLYALPRLLLLHVAHAVFIGVVTSSYFGRFGAYWRFHASLLMLALPAYEVWRLGGFAENIPSLIGQKEGQTVFHFWRMRMVRFVGFAVIDAMLGLLVWLSATRRWKFGWEGYVVEERIEESLKKMHAATTLMQASGLLKQTVMRDPELRGECVEWWAREDTRGRELMGDEEVMQVRKERLSDGVNLDSLRKEAEERSRSLVYIMSNLVHQREQAPEEKPHQQ